MLNKEEIKKYQYEVNEIIRNSDGLTTPQIAEKMDNLRRDMFGNLMDYTEIKKHYNQLMLQTVDKALLLQGFAIVGTAFLI